MIDFGKESFLGSKAIFERRAKGLSHKIVGVSAAPGVKEVAKGASVFSGAAKAGEIVASCFSYVLNAQLGLALLPVDVAFAGLTFNLGAERGPELHTISMPPIMPKSLTVKLDEL